MQTKEGKSTFPEFFINAIEAYSEEFESPKSIGVSWSKNNKTIKAHFSKEDFDRKNTTILQFENQTYRMLDYSVLDSNIDDNFDLWRSIRNTSKKIILPTVVLHYVDNDLYDFPINTDTEIFGRAVIKNFRDEIMGHHAKKMEWYEGKTKEEIVASFNDSWSDEMKASQTIKAEFFCSMNKNQKAFLNDYILQLIDNIGFSVMRSIDESSFRKDCKGISVMVNGKRAEELDMIGNGNLSGEYLDWIERFSAFKEFQV